MTPFRHTVEAPRKLTTSRRRIQPRAYRGVVRSLAAVPHNPMLPGFLKELTISGMRVGNSKVSLHFAWRGDRTLVNLFAVDGAPIQVRIELG